MEIKKIENKDYVMLPRLQHPGLKPMHVERDAFKAELNTSRAMATTGCYTSRRSPMS